MPWRLRALLVAGTLLVLTTGGRAQQERREPRPGDLAPQQPDRTPAASSQEPQQPVFRTGVSFVRVDAIVTDRDGNPVLDLKLSDFEVLEDDVPQTIETFKLIRVDGSPEPGAPSPRPIRSTADEEREAAREDVRLIALFLDDYHVRRGASMRVRQELANFIRTYLEPTDLVAVMYPLTSIGDVTLTWNHQAAIRAIEQFDGVKYDYTPRNDFEARYAYYPAETVERIRNQASLSALKSLVVHLGGLREGRKAVILVSEGYTGLLPPQLRDPIAAVPGLGNPNRRNPSAGDRDAQEQAAQFFANADVLNDLREVYDTANRYNASIYAVDPRGLASFEFDIDEGVGMRTDAEMLRTTTDTLRVLAEQTDGRAIVSQNDLEKGLRQIVRDSSVYYLMGYNSTLAPSDGRFHEIKVRVKRRGVQVRARKGYWALTAEETERALTPKPGPPPAVTEALATVVEPPRGRTVRTWVGMMRGEGGRTRVTFVWEPVAPPPGQRAELAARVSLVAAGEDGSPYFRGRVPDVALAVKEASVSAAAAAQAGAVASRPSQVVFEAVPGPMQLRLSVEGPAGQVLDTDVRQMRLPDFTRPDVMLSTPAVFRARNAFELRALQTDPQAVPVAAREFRRTDRLLVRFAAYGPGGTVPEVVARLLNRMGQSMSAIPVQPVSTGFSQAEVPLAGLPPGEYLVEIAAASADSQAKELIAFRVTS